jgi:hypothetical protein
MFGAGAQVSYAVWLSLKLAFGLYNLGRLSVIGLGFLKLALGSVHFFGVCFRSGNLRNQRIFHRAQPRSFYRQRFRLFSGLWLIRLLAVGLSGAIAHFSWRSSWLAQRRGFVPSSANSRFGSTHFLLSKSCKIWKYVFVVSCGKGFGQFCFSVANFFWL